MYIFKELTIERDDINSISFSRLPLKFCTTVAQNPCYILERLPRHWMYPSALNSSLIPRYTVFQNFGFISFTPVTLKIHLRRKKIPSIVNSTVIRKRLQKMISIAD